MTNYLNSLVKTRTYNWEHFPWLQIKTGSVYPPFKVRNSVPCPSFSSLVLIHYKEQWGHKHSWKKESNNWIFLLSFQLILEHCLHHLFERSTNIAHKYFCFFLNILICFFLLLLFLTLFLSIYIQNLYPQHTHMWPCFPRVNWEICN